MKQWKRRIVWLLLALCLFAGGCDTKQEDIPAEPVIDMDEYQQAFHNRDKVNWPEQVWKKPGEVTAADPYWGAESREGIMPSYDREPQRYVLMSNMFAGQGKDSYILSQYWVYDTFDVDDYVNSMLHFTDRRYSLTHISADTLEPETILCEPYYCGEGPLQGAAVCDIDCDGEKVFLLMEVFEQTEGYVEHCYVVSVDGAGKLNILYDMKDTLTDCGLLQEPHAILSRFRMDHAGYVYLLSEKSDALVVLGPDGKLADEYTGSGQKQKRQSISFCLKTADGSCIWRDDDILFTYEGGGRKELCTADFVAEPAFMNAYGDICHVVDGQDIRLWNMVSGSCECICKADSSELSGTRLISQNEKGELVLIKEDEMQNCYLTVYSPGTRRRDVTLSLYSCEPGSALQDIVSAFERKHPGVHIEVTCPEGTAVERERDWIEIVNAMTKGKGPDLLCLPRKELRALAVKQVLMPLDEILPAGLTDRVYPAVWDYGRIDGVLYGATFDGGCRTILVPNAIWSEDSWTREEVLTLLQEREDAGNSFAGVCNDMYSCDGLTAEDMLRFFLEGVGQSDYVDLEQGSCNFRDEKFKALLECCKKYGKPVPDSFINDEETRLSQYEAVREGKLLGYYMTEYSSGFVNFSETMGRFENLCHPVGFPTDLGYGNYFIGGSAMAVNKACSEKKLIAEFLEYLYSAEVQWNNIGTPVRRDFLENSIVEKVGWSEYSFFHIPGQRGWVQIAEKPGGGTYLADYLKLMENCCVRPDIADELIELVIEQAKDYFYSTKTPDAVIEIIQSKAELLLAEQN